ncbi:MAG: hypothetical protein MJ220_02510 [Bacilli bacterium]|nr:hypothetical protein [Bacilli bacterium]
MKSAKFIIAAVLAATSSLVPHRANESAAPVSVYYIDAVNGKSTNDGSEEHPFDKIETALKKSGDLELHLKGSHEYKVKSTETAMFADGHNNVSIIGEDGMFPKFGLGNSDTTDGNQGFIGTNLFLDKVSYTNYGKGRHMLFACGNNLTFGSNCEVDNDSFPTANGYDTGIEFGRDIQIYAGCNGAGGKGTPLTGQYEKGPAIKGKLEGNSNTLTFLSGDFGRITLSNRLADTGSESNRYQPKLVVGGTAYVSYVGASNDWFNYIDSTITVQDDARIHRIVGGISGYIYTPSVLEKVYIHSGKTTINIKGGYVKNVVGGSMGRSSAFVKHIGDTEINVSGGYVESLLGGSAAGNTYGNISVNVTGGTFGVIEDVEFGVGSIVDDDKENHKDAGFYCGGAGMSSMIHTDEAKLRDELYGPLGCCYKENDILDPTKKVMAMGNVYGKINANITGGTFNCNIYGGGKGFDHNTIAPSDKKDLLFNVAQVAKGVTLSVSGCTVNGNVYGGGAGIVGATEDYSRIALVAGTIDLTIGDSITAPEGANQPSDYNTVINGTVYGGGVYPTVTSLGAKDPVIVLKVQNAYIDNPDGDIAIHGGSEFASVDGNLALEIKGSYVNDSIYLGSGSGSINGSIDIDILDSQVNGDLTLGSVEGDINGDVNVLVEGLSVINDINVGSDSGTINGKVDVTISSTSVNNDINVGTKEDTFNNDIEVTINKGTTIGGTVNDNTHDANLDLNISENTTIKGEMVYVKSFIRAKGNYTNARLEADYRNKPEGVDIIYHWYKVDPEGDIEVYSGSNNYIEDLTSSDVGSYYCKAEYKKGTVDTFVQSNTARFAEKSEVKGAQVAFDSTPTFNFFVEVSSDFTDSSKATFTIGERSVEATGVANTSLGYKTYKFSVALAPYEMASDIRISIASEGVDSKYSVKQYCREVLEDENTSDKLRALVTSLLNYGAASQEYFDYAKYSLANSYLSEADKALSTSIGEEYNKLLIENNSDDVQAYSATVEILTSTTIRVYFTEKTKGAIEGYKAYIDGEEISSDKLLYKNNRYYVEIEGVSAKDMDKAFTVKLAKDETNYVSVTYSVLTYAYSKQNSSNSALRNFALSLYDYYKAVEGYKN